MRRPKPVVLVILDGWGHRESGDHNAIAAARTPVWDALMRDYPHGLLDASGPAVGLPKGQMGNSEVGHMHIGGGRLIMQELPRIDAAIADDSLAANPRLRAFIASLKKSGGACHLMGLLSDGGVHAHQRHMAYLANALAKEGIAVWLHVFLDGRDTPPKSAEGYVQEFLRETNNTNVKLASLTGRYWAMDRDNRWERVAPAYEALVDAKAPKMSDPLQAIAQSYASGATDEFVKPVVAQNYTGMKDGGGLLMANFRADRAREILSALLLPDFDKFTRTRKVAFAAALGMVEYADFLNPHMAALFPPQTTTRILGEEVSRAGLTQLRLAETEKYAHVTFFFNGGREEVFPGETRILVPSPKVATYDLQPEMSAPEVTGKLVDAISSGAQDVIVVNYANTDMVGHTGNLAAATKAVEAVDACLGRVLAAVEKAGGAMLITADHGNAEMMEDAATAQPHTAHTLNLVPVILAGPQFKGTPAALGTGTLADIAPTMLELLQLPIPAEMTGHSLLKAIHAR